MKAFNRISTVFLAASALTGCLGGSGGDSSTDSSASNDQQNISYPSTSMLGRQQEQCGTGFSLTDHWEICDEFFKVYPEYEPKGLWMPSGYRRPKQHFFIPGLIEAAVDKGLTGEGADLVISDNFFSWHEFFDTSRLTSDSLRVTEASGLNSKADNVIARVFGWTNVLLKEPGAHGTQVYSVATGGIGISPSASTTLHAASFYLNDKLKFGYLTDSYEYLPAGILNSSNDTTQFADNNWYSSTTERTSLWRDDLNEIKDYASRGGVFVVTAGNDLGFSLSDAGNSGKVAWDKGCASHSNTNPRAKYVDGVSDPVCEAMPLHEAIPDAMIYVGSFKMGTNSIAQHSNVPGSNPEIQKRFIVAPGEQVTVASTYEWINFSEKVLSETGTRKTNGTSFAAPAVSGAIALVKEAKPELNYKEAMQWVLDNADDSFTGYDPEKHGVGRLDLSNL